MWFVSDFFGCIFIKILYRFQIMKRFIKVITIVLLTVFFQNVLAQDALNASGMKLGDVEIYCAPIDSAGHKMVWAESGGRYLAMNGQAIEHLSTYFPASQIELARDFPELRATLNDSISIGLTLCK